MDDSVFLSCFPWKLSLPVGFWGNLVVVNENNNITPTKNSYELKWDNVIKTADYQNFVSDDVFNLPIPISEEKTANENDVDFHRESIADGMNDTDNKNQAGVIPLGNILSVIWMVGVIGFVGYYIYAYAVIRYKVSVSIPYKNNIMWTENIETPMVFGIWNPKIYLPISVEREMFPYIVAHERIHIKRKDSLLKMFCYFICIIHWFNPLVWFTYFLVGSDMEKACDEEVLQKIGEEHRKKYAYSLLHIAAGAGTKEKKIFVAPICFDEGNVNERIKNIIQYKYTISAIGAGAFTLSILLAGAFVTQTQKEITGQDMDDVVEVSISAEKTEEQKYKENDIQLQPDCPFFYAEDLTTLQVEDAFSLKDYYITSRYTASNHFYIDEQGILWGTGGNQYGQLGTGSYSEEEWYDNPVKIAENVVSVDASWNDYFCIYLTENGDLYGVGLNCVCVLLGKGSEKDVYSYADCQRVTTPVLLMHNVAYARAGIESIVALQNTKTAYWWGQYAPLTHSTYGGDYWKLEEDNSNSAKMFSSEPMKILDNCRYITTGTFTGAAISEAGELFTWGFNIFGQCGIEVTEDDFVRKPVKVLDDVKMVWVDKIEFNDPKKKPSDFLRRDMDYLYNTFVLTKDNSLLAAGHNLGNKEKMTEVNGDLLETQLHLYSDTFIPIEVVEYSETANRGQLNRLMFGMSMEETEKILQESGLKYFQSISEDDKVLCVEDSRYYCYFDKQNELIRLLIQEGGSRDNRFTLGISLFELEKLVEQEDGQLIKEADDMYCYADKENNIMYKFHIYKEKIAFLWEEAVDTLDVSQ